MNKVQLQIGDIVKGIVTETCKSYAQISLGDIDAILPSTEYSWNKSVNIKNVMKVDDEITAVVIILYDHKVVLSVKRLKDNPWKDIDTKYTIGQKVKGKVTALMSFGALVELEDGLLGLLHKSQMSNDGTATPSSLLTENQEIEVKIASIEADKKRMSFSIKSQI